MKNFIFAIFILFAQTCPIHATDIKAPKLLIKIPTRSRPTQFFKVLDGYYKNLSGQIPYHFLITCDIDDSSMNCSKVKSLFQRYPHLTVTYSDNHSKVEAYNRDVNKFSEWFDILLVTSDDTEVITANYDKIIVEAMQQHFPDYDGVLHYNDGYVGEILNTLPIIGCNYYKRFGYIYHPAYSSLWCDNELNSVSRMLDKEVYIDQILIKHNHPLYTGAVWDDLLTRNESFYMADKTVFDARRANNFEIPDSLLKQLFPKDWSILICTLDERQSQFNKLYSKLKWQIEKNGLQNKVEILYFKDNREHSVGYKRNKLLKQSKGLYINFIDDDDEVHRDYIKLIYDKLKSHPDCVSLKGVITFDSLNPRYFIHSIKYNSYFEKEKVYYRPPNHLNPIKRCIACQFLFPNKNFSEDTDWAMMIAKSHLLKIEEEITIPYYFYHYKTKKNKSK